jgi:hypothetical protein
MAITAEIQLPAGFGFSLAPANGGRPIWAPCAYEGYDWRVWKSIPVGIEYEVREGPNEKIVRWDPAMWSPSIDWNETAWPVKITSHPTIILRF